MKRVWHEDLPHCERSKMVETKFYYGKRCSSGEQIMIDRRSIQRPNGFVFGQPGSGKTLAIKQEINQVIHKTADPIIIIDEGGEYSGLATGVNLFDERSAYHINPLDVYIGNNTCERIIPYDAAFAMLEEMIGRPLAPYECAAIERACDIVFDPFIQRLKTEEKCCDYADNPTLKDVADVLIALPKPSELRLIVALKETIQRETNNENKNLSSRVNDCIEKTFCYSAVGGLTEEIHRIYVYIDSYFSYKTNMPDDRVIQLAWRYMPNNIGKAAYTACLRYAWNRIVQHREAMSNAKKYGYLWIYLENTDGAFRSVTKGLANSLTELYRRSRPYGSIVTLIAQDYMDILNSDKGRACIVNTEFIRFLSMSPADRENIRDLYHLSDDMMEYICNAPCGHGLLAVNSDWIPFELKYTRKDGSYAGFF